MKKWGYLLFSVVIVLGVLIYRDIFHPPLPIDSVSKKEVLEQVENSSGKFVKVAEENSFQWYIAEMDDGAVYDDLKALMKDKGWNFKEQAEAGFIFESEAGEIIVSSGMWTKKYIIFHFPKDI